MNTFRGSMRRLALLSATAIALGGLVSTPAARAATAPDGRPPARAATPAFLRQMAQALSRTRSYQITIRTASSSSGQPISATSTATVVRQGTMLRLYITTSTHHAGQESTLEEVLTGAPMHAHERTVRLVLPYVAAQRTQPPAGLRQNSESVVANR